MNGTKAQEWFLIKKNWMEELKDLSNEEFGLLVRSLFTSGEPEGTLKMIYGLLKDEYDRVNANREEGLLKRREASLKGVEARKNKTSGEPEVNRTHTHTHTPTHTQTQTPTGTPIEKNTPTNTKKKKSTYRKAKERGIYKDRDKLVIDPTDKELDKIDSMDSKEFLEYAEGKSYEYWVDSKQVDMYAGKELTDADRRALKKYSLNKKFNEVFE